MTASPRPASSSSSAPRKTLTLLQMLTLIAIGGLAASLALRYFV